MEGKQTIKTKHMIHENNPAQPVGMYGQQSSPGETLLMKYSAMFMVGMVSTHDYRNEDRISTYLAHQAIDLARTLITELNKEITPSKPVPQHEVNY